MPINNPNSSNNNTTGLNETSFHIGTRYDLHDPNAREISSNISRENFQAGIKTDAKLKKFRDTVYKMVSTWPAETKIRIIAEYGDSDRLKKNPSDKQLNEQLTETLIIHLSQSDLNKLISDVQAEDKRLSKEVRKIQDTRKKVQTSFNAGTFEETYKQIQYLNKEKKILKEIKNVDKTYKIPKNIQSQFGKLKRELLDVLSTCYNKIEIRNLAVSMGIEITSEMLTKQKILSDSIINKTILYVALITGKSKRDNLSAAFFDVAPYNDLLQYTSYSYITGKPGMNLRAWKKLKDEARQAQMQSKILSRIQTQRERKSSKFFKDITGRNRTTLSSLKNDDTGLLANASYNELIELAGKYGVEIKSRSIARLKMELYRAIAADNKRQAQINKALEKSSKKRILPGRALIDEIAIRKSLGDPLKGATDDKTLPIVKVGATGILSDITRAVPVYVVGSGGITAPKAPSSVIKGNLGGIRKGIDKSITEKSMLSDSDRDLLNYILSLTDEGSSGQASVSSSITREIPSLYELKYNLMERGVRDKYITAALSYSGIKQKYAFAWLYAYVTGRRKLVSYITNITGIHFTGRIRSLGGTIIGKLSIGMSNFNKKISARFTRAKNKTFEELSADSQKLYSALNQLDAEDLRSRVRNYYGNSIDSARSSVSGQKIIDDTESCMALLAKAFGNNELAKYLEARVQKRISDFKLKNFKTGKLNTFGRGFLRPFRAIKRFFTGPGNEKEGIAEVVSAPNPIDNTGNLKPSIVSMGKIGGEINLNDINAMAVYVVNDAGLPLKDIKGKSSSSTLGTITTTRSVEGRGPGRNRILKNDKGPFVGLDETNPFVADISNIHQALQNEAAKNNGQQVGSQPLAIRTFDSSPLIFDKKSAAGLVSAAATNIGIKQITKQPATPVYIVNNRLPTEDSNLLQSMSSYFSTLFTGLASEVVSAPMGVGAITRPGLIAGSIIEKAKTALNQTASYTYSKVGLAATGAKVTRMPTGGTAVVTGDAASSNIFANGAKPELVQSNGDMKVTPLKRAGTETKQKISRMTQAERNSALATSISSHVIKVSYSLPNGATDISNIGEAIKVFNVKPGITDEIDIGNGQTTSLIGLLGTITAQLATMVGYSETNAKLLTTVAANTTQTTQKSSYSGNPFAGGFPDSLDGILTGE